MLRKAAGVAAWAALATASRVTIERPEDQQSAAQVWPFTKNVDPEQIHLAIGGPGQMSVMWYTKDEADTVVEYGPTTALGKKTSGGSKQYLKWHGHHHSAMLSGLTPGAKYYYTVGDGKKRSAVNSFRAAPDSEDATFSVNVLGDWGWLSSEKRPMAIAKDGLQKHWSAEPSRKTMELLKDSGKLDWVWHVGDIAYADDSFGHWGCIAEFCYEKVQNGFANWIQNVSAAMPYMVSVGNHESECHSPVCIIDPFLKKALGNFSAYNTRWTMPSASSGGRANMWYSFDYGPAHFISINTETDFPGAGEETKGDGGFTKCGSFGAPGEYLRWLEQDLKKAASTGKWIIAGGHRPWNSGELKNATDLLEQYGTAMYFAGHGHSYARGMSSKNVSYVMVGGAGCDEKPDEELDSRSKREWMFAQASGGYTTALTATGVLDVSNKTLSWRLIEGSTQKVLDTWTVSR